MAKQRWDMGVWARLIVSIAALLLIIFCVGLIFEGSHSSSNDIAFGIVAGFSALAALGQWFFPLVSEKPKRLIFPYAHELSSASFRMGDTTAANFDYILVPIKEAYNIARETLNEISVGGSSKRGILILGGANTGKTRLAFEVLTKALTTWKVLLWNSNYDELSKVPEFTFSSEPRIVIFIDDLQEYVPPDDYDDDVMGFVPDNRISTLQAFLNNMSTIKSLAIIATCRLEDETRVGARLRWLFDQLQEVVLSSFQVETSNSQSANILELFRQHGAKHIEDWDGTLGSLVLGLTKKRSQYEGLVSSHNRAASILRAMKLLSLAHISTHTSSRIQGICMDIYGESILYEDSKVWQDKIDQLIRLEFITEVKDQTSGGYALVIRKDTYFDKVITDYPAAHRHYQFEQHLKQLQKVFIRLNDIFALIDLANDALRNLKRYEEALAAYEQAIRLDSQCVSAHYGRGNVLNDLKRY